MSDDRVATRETSRVALITCTALPGLDEDDRLLLGPLAARGIAADPVIWDASGTDWSRYRLAVLRSPWDYVARRAEFVAWSATVPRLANPADIVEWNTDKRYLADLAGAGVPVVPTTWIGPDTHWQLPDAGEYVIKPTVGVGSVDTGRYRLTDAGHRRLAASHVDRMRSAGRQVMLQPYLALVDTAGETALLFIGGPNGLTFSHAVRKDAMLTGPAREDEGMFRQEKITACAASAAQHAVAEQALAAVPGGVDRLLYARVDVLPGPDGAPLLVELELTEPSLFLGHADGAAERFADAVLSRLG